MVVYYLLTTLYVLICLLLLLVILLQQGKGDMAAAFGGGSSQSAFGARGGRDGALEGDGRSRRPVHDHRAGAGDHRAARPGLDRERRGAATARAAGTGARDTAGHTASGHAARGHTSGAAQIAPGSTSAPSRPMFAADAKECSSSC